MDRTSALFFGFSLLGLVRANAVGKTISRASPWSIWLNALLATMLIVVAIVGTVVWEHAPGIHQILASPMASLTEAWIRAYGDHLLAGVGVLYFVLPIACALFVLLSAWTHLIDIHRAGSAPTSFSSAARVASASLWPALFLIVGCCASGELLHYILTNHPKIRQFLGSPPTWPIVLLPGIPFCGLLLATWTLRAIEEVSIDSPEFEPSPRCEGCGYDLTHRPADDRCPECGASVRASLQPSIRRIGSAWERQGGARGCLRTVVEVVVAPRSFYGRLRLRIPIKPVCRFARLQLIAIGIGAGTWMLFLLFGSKTNPLRGVGYFLSVAFALLIPFVGWGLHRLLTGLIMLDWIRRRALPDFAWARKIFYYESAYLWVFCLFNGFFITWLIATDGKGLSDLLALVGIRLTALGSPLEPAVMLAGNGLLCCLWVWRYYIALAAIRWSNV